MKTYSLRGMLPLVSLFTPLFANGQEAHKTEKPNIIFVLADDMSYRDLSCYGQQRYRTPHLDSLAMQGVRFSQAYAAAPESAPSRCCMLTGLHTGHSSVRMNSSARGQDNILDSDVTVAEVLKEAGYHTAFVGNGESVCREPRECLTSRDLIIVLAFMIRPRHIPISRTICTRMTGK